MSVTVTVGVKLAIQSRRPSGAHHSANTPPYVNHPFPLPPPRPPQGTESLPCRGLLLRLPSQAPFYMSLSSTSTVKAQLTNALGSKAPLYFSVLKEYLAGRISRNEYDDKVKTYLDSVPLRESQS